MNKRIGILTQPLESNYGGILQAWALQKYLKKCGYEVILLNIRYFKEKTLLFKIAHTTKTFFERVLLRKKSNYVFINNSVSIINKKLSFFIKDEFNITEELNTKNKLYEALFNLKLDALIVGSDQVWRPKYSPFLPIYFFEGVDSSVRKIVYAASFGVDSWEYSEAQTEYYRVLSGKIDAISVREESAIDLCQKYLNLSPIHVLDPTMLLDVNEYVSLINKRVNISKEFNEDMCFTYVLDITKEKEQIIDDICTKKGLAKYSLLDDCERAQNSNVYIKEPVEKWLASFKNAQFVITDSFHGCVFAILFNKPFYALINDKRGSSRFYSLLNQFDLLDRLSVSSVNDDIDWSNVNSKLKVLKEKSKSFLGNNI